MTPAPVLRDVALVLAHVPSLVALGSKPRRELATAEGAVETFSGALRDYAAAKAYPPNQVFVGNLTPNELAKWSRPWFQNPVEDAAQFGPDGEILPETDFLGLLRLADDFQLFGLEEELAARAGEGLTAHPVLSRVLGQRRPKGLPRPRLEDWLTREAAVPVRDPRGSLIAVMRAGHAEDEALAAPVLLENLACKASAALALAHLLSRPGGLSPGAVRYVINCGEEAVGDRYQRGGGNLAKAVAEWVGCERATGMDVKAFCCGPMHALLTAGALVQSRVFDDVIVLAGGSLTKLGMKFQGHLRRAMPMLEDLLAGFAAHVARDDGRSPRLRLDAVGRHEVGTGSSPVGMARALYIAPLELAGLTLLDVDRFSLELHNPEITEPAGSGNVPLTNYRTLASLAVLHGLIPREGVEAFVETRGLPGFSPTQGHIASAVPYLGHARRSLTDGLQRRVMFAGKGSLFLGRMSQLTDGLSLLVERNPALG